MKQSQRILKNGLMGLTSNFFGGLIQFATLIMIARSIPVEDFGTYSFLLSFASIFKFLADLGLSNILIREMSKDLDNIEKLLGATRLLMWLMSIGSFILLFLFVSLLSFPIEVKGLALLMGVGTLLNFNSTGYTAVFRAFEDMGYNALGFVLHKILVLAFTYLSLVMDFGLLGLIGSFVLASFLLLNFYAIIISKRYCKVRFNYNLGLWRHLIKEALPLGGGILIRQSSSQVDIMLLGILTSLSFVGLFSGPYRVILALILIPLGFILPVFPMFSRLASDNRSLFFEAFERCVRFISLLSFPLVMLFYVFAPFLVTSLLGPKYYDSINIFRILSFYILPMFITSVVPFAFTALGKQKTYCVISFIGLLMHIIFMLAFVKTIGDMGSCYAILLSEFIIISISLFALSKEGGSWKFIFYLIKPATASLAVGALISIGFNYDNFWGWLGLLTFPFIYLVLLLAMKAFSSQDIALIKESLGIFYQFNKNKSRQAVTER